MVFNNPGSRLERAVWHYLILQQVGTRDDTYFADYTGERILPNRTIVGYSFTPKHPFRPEGTVGLQIQHHFKAVEQNPAVPLAQMLAKNEFVGETYDSMSQGDGQSFNLTADAITEAGRLLAVASGPEAEAIAFAQQNADMANFRCDWIEHATPLHTRGRPNVEGAYWVEILHFIAFVSTAGN